MLFTKQITFSEIVTWQSYEINNQLYLSKRIPDQTFQLSRFLDFSVKMFSSVKPYANKCFFHYLTLSFIVIHTMNAIKNITVLGSTKILFWKHSIRTFKRYFERHTFNSIINSGKLVQKLSSEQFFFQNIKIESSTKFLIISTVTRMKRLYICFNFWEKKQRKYSSPWKQNVWKRLF